MSASTASQPYAIDRASRRLVAGLLLSMVLHALLLLLQFGVPALSGGAPMRLVLKLARAPEPAPELPARASPEGAEAAAQAPAVAVVPAAGGFHMVAPRPDLAAPAATVRRPRAAKRISAKSSRRARLHERVIVQAHPVEPTFVVPLPEIAPAPEKSADPIALQDGAADGQGSVAAKEEQPLARDDAGLAAQVPAVADASAVQPNPAQRDVMEGSPAGERERQRAQQVQARIEQEHQAQEQARKLAEVQAQRQIEEERARQQAEAERRHAEQLATARREQEDAARRDAELVARQHAEQLAQQRSTEDEAARREADELLRKQAIQARQRAAEVLARQLAEQERQRAADELARQQMEQAQQRAAEELARQQAEQERQRAEELARQQMEQARQRAAEELARRQMEQAQQRAAEELAQQQMELARQRAAEELARQQADQTRQRAADDARPAGQAAQPAPALAGGPGVASGAGGSGTGASGSRGLPGDALASRARQLLRGLDILKGAPPVAIRAEDPQRAGRRVVANGTERDLPLRFYVDSFRQKIERNGMLNRAQLPAGRVRIDPVVSVALRSDGSVEDVLIVRSSGHPDTDEAVRRIVRLNERFAAFPPNVAARFDIIEIRRIWVFAEGLKLLEEVR